jgi:hypothetical protein
VTDFNKIKAALTHERLKKYAYNPKTNTSYDDEEIFKRYLYNMELAGEINKAIHVFEVLLRNSIVVNWNLHFIDTDWPLNKKHIHNSKKYDDVLKDIDNAIKIIKNHYTNDDIVAALTLGFWKKMLSSKFDVQNINLVKKIFPYRKSWQRRLVTDIRIIYDSIEIVWRLRNRIAHHEPIFHRADLINQYEIIVELIQSIDEESLYLLRDNRFKQLFKNGWQ